jgi:hypothetical protein
MKRFYAFHLEQQRLRLSRSTHYSDVKKWRIVILIYPKVWHGATENGP